MNGKCSCNKGTIQEKILDAAAVESGKNQSNTNTQIGGSQKWRLVDDSAVEQKVIRMILIVQC